MNQSHYFETQDVPTRLFHHFLKPFEIERVMNWQMINDSTIGSFESLPFAHPNGNWANAEWASFEGVPLPLIVQSLNMRGKRGWFSIPTFFNAQAVKKLVRYLITACDLKPLIQSSNEEWNNQFRHVQRLVRSAFIPESEVERWTFNGNINVPMLTAYHVAERTKLIKKFAEGNAYVVLCGQFKNTDLTRRLVSLIHPEQYDFFAVAPYIGAFQRADIDQHDDPFINAARLEIRSFASIARKHAELSPKPLLAYEGGLHYVPRNDRTPEHFEFERAYFQSLNRSTVAGELTYELIEMCARNGFTAFMPYSFATTYENVWSGEPMGQFFGHVEVVARTDLKPLPKYFYAVQALRDFGLHTLENRLWQNQKDEPIYKSFLLT